MSDEALIGEVRTWLQRHGYVLEMEVAQAVAAHAEWVWQGDHYNDPLTDKVREIDVHGLWIGLATEEEGTHSLSVFFECKSTTAPWILFAGSSEPEYRVGLAHYDDDCQRCRALESGIARALQDWGVDAYAITQKRDPKGVDHAQEAVHQAVSAALGKTGAGLAAEGHNDEYLTTFAIPAVVTRSPLVICSLGQGGDVNLTVADRALVEVAIRRGVEGYEKYSVFVMSVSALDDFLARMTAILPVPKMRIG